MGLNHPVRPAPAVVVGPSRLVGQHSPARTSAPAWRCSWPRSPPTASHHRNSNRSTAATSNRPETAQAGAHIERIGTRLARPNHTRDYHARYHIHAIQQEVARQRDDIHIPGELVASPHGLPDRPRRRRAQAEMHKLGSRYPLRQHGNTLGRIRRRPRILLYDSQSTRRHRRPCRVAVGPLHRQSRRRPLLRRGACAKKQQAGHVYGLAIAQRLACSKLTAYYFGNMEEWCDGIACTPRRARRHRPDFVVSANHQDAGLPRAQGPSNADVPKGRSAHAASNHLGDNAIYRSCHHRRHQPPGAATGRKTLPRARKITVTDMRLRPPASTPCPTSDRLHRPRLTSRESARRAATDPRPRPASMSPRRCARQMFRRRASYTASSSPSTILSGLGIDAETRSSAGLETARRIRLPNTSRKWNFSTTASMGGQSRHPLHRLRPRRGRDCPHRQRQRAADDVVEGDRIHALLPGLLGN